MTVTRTNRCISQTLVSASNFVSSAWATFPILIIPSQINRKPDDGHSRKAGRLSNLASSQEVRFQRLGNLCDLENAISNIEKAAQLTNDDHPTKSLYLAHLGETQIALGFLVDLESAVSNTGKAVELTDDNHP